MPNRIIKESIHTSEKINALTDFQFRLWVSLICYVDDYGRGDARPPVIRGKCFPLRDRVTNRDIEAALSKLADAGCVGLYTVDGKPYLYLLNWESHQRIRQKVSKCPEPPLTADCGNLPQVAASCGELPQNAAECGLNPESRIQNTEYGIQNTEYEEEANASCAEPPDTGRSTQETKPQPTPSAFNIPLNDGTFYNVPVENIEFYARTYPGADVEQELRNMIGWCYGNPTKRKTKSGIKRFIANWLQKAQNEGRGNANGVNQGSADGMPRKLYDAEIVV